MSENRFQNKYRIPSARADWHSYEGGVFFVTVCTQYRQNYFGEIECGEMRLSELGKYLAEQIVITPQMHSDMNVEIPSFVIMPNHVHMIVVINDNEYNMLDYNAAFQCRDGIRQCRDGMRQCRDAMHCVSTFPNTRDRFPKEKRVGRNFFRLCKRAHCFFMEICSLIFQMYGWQCGTSRREAFLPFW